LNFREGRVAEWVFQQGKATWESFDNGT